MPSYDECLVEAELRARAAYAEPHRHYHDQRHLDACLALLDEEHDLTGRERRVLRWAILWHDAVYDPQRTDNEERSAEVARQELLACGVDGADVNEVARLVLLTKGHKAKEGDWLGALLVSIDLSILGSDWDRYRQYAAGVRAEYAHLPDEGWRLGRYEALKHLLEATPLFPDPRFRDRLEMQARRNIEDEIRNLIAG